MNSDHMDTMTAWLCTAFSLFYPPSQDISQQHHLAGEKMQYRSLNAKFFQRFCWYIYCFEVGTTRSSLMKGINTDPLQCKYYLATIFQKKKAKNWSAI